MRKITPTHNVKNLLYLKAPTFVNWSVAPGTLADITDEYMGKAITTPGTTLANATCTWDMGRLVRCIMVLDHEHADMITWASRDNITWYQVSLAQVGAVAGIWRYIQIRCGAHASVSYLKVIVYEM